MWVYILLPTFTYFPLSPTADNHFSTLCFDEFDFFFCLSILHINNTMDGTTQYLPFSV